MCVFFTTSTTLPFPLASTYFERRRPKWTIFVNHRIKNTQREKTGARSSRYKALGQMLLPTNQRLTSLLRHVSILLAVQLEAHVISHSLYGLPGSHTIFSFLVSN